MNTLKKTLNLATIKAYTCARQRSARLREILRDNSGQFVMDHSIQFVLAIVLGGIILLLLKNFVVDDMAPTLKAKIMEFFN